MGNWVRRVGAVLVGVAAALALGAAAYAHVEVEVEPAVAGTTDAVITFDAEAEADSAGIVKVQVFLPADLPPSTVTLKQAPAGWTLTPGADSYTVAGPALRQGVHAVHSVTVARLPMSTRLVFKVLVTYSSGSVDRWIEEPTAANPNPDNLAPVVELSPAATTPTSAPATSAPPTTPAVAATNPPSATPESGGATWLWWVLGLIVLAAVVTGVVLARRRRGPASTAVTGGGAGPT